MTTYIRDLIDIPDQVRTGDFVLRLSEGLTRPKETIERYVVTEQLARSFDTALSFVRAAIDSKSSKATYLHGSFGSGKSHFMAILLLLLQNNADARSLEGLEDIVHRHNDWTSDKKFLLVPYHMIGAKDMESAVLGGYVEHTRRIHPDAPLPGVYLSDKIFADARSLLDAMGDAKFFTKLNESAGAGATGWGEIAKGWDAASFDQATKAPPTSEDRSRLVGDLVRQYYSAMISHSEFVDLDTGLSIISKHAKSLGYDALILFLDELVLWLASHAADMSFLNREGQKLAKLVEAQKADRPIPIVSFVARQRDLSGLVRDQTTGAELSSFTDVLRWWEARFDQITLEDRNLPAIAEKRLLRPKDNTARQLIDADFAKTVSIRETVLDVLLTGQATRDMFRKVYPFSPALIETLVEISFLLQRERTALRVMLQLLVDQREWLRLGDVVPVGDLFDPVAEGNDAISESIKTSFDNAKKLYVQKLKPILEREHELRFEDAANLPPLDAKVVALRNDGRLIKTLLLSALAPNVEPLRSLTVERLAALNHGTIKTPIPGTESTVALGKLRKWAAEVGELKISDDSPTNPSISVQITGVDTEGIIANGRSEDNAGNRIRKIRELIFAQLGIALEEQMFKRHDFLWRATKRSCNIVFGNIRDMTFSDFGNGEEDWKVIIDYPFDKEGHSPHDDVSKIDEYRLTGNPSARTLLWVPAFLSLQAKRELALLVILDHVLKGDRFNDYASHLAAVERAQARTILENQQRQLQQRMISYMEGAYGIIQPPKGSTDESFELTKEEQFQSLDEGFQPNPPVGANLKQAFEGLLDQSLKYQFPKHPTFEPDTKLTPAILRRVYETIERATQVSDGRIPIDQPLRKDLRLIANPLKIGEMTLETHFILHDHWQRHFSQKHAEHGGDLTVGRLRAWIDEPEPWGLKKELQNLVVMTFAAQTNRSFYRYGGSITPTLDGIPDDAELREQALPSEQDWLSAGRLGSSIFGVTASPLCNAMNVAKFVDEVKRIASEHREACDELLPILKRHVLQYSGVGADTARVKTALATRMLVDDVSKAAANDMVQSLCAATIETSESAMGTSLKKARLLVDVLNGTKWNLFDAIKKLDGRRGEAARLILSDLEDALSKDEYAIALAPVLASLEGKAAQLLADIPSPAGPQPGKAGPDAPPAPPPAKAGAIKIDGGSESVVTRSEFVELAERIEQHLEKDESARLRINWEVYKP
jgi:hypothetical protein